jgi:hypothetical protein
MAIHLGGFQSSSNGTKIISNCFQQALWVQLHNMTLGSLVFDFLEMRTCPNSRTTTPCKCSSNSWTCFCSPCLDSTWLETLTLSCLTCSIVLHKFLIVMACACSSCFSFTWTATSPVSCPTLSSKHSCTSL